MNWSGTRLCLRNAASVLVRQVLVVLPLEGMVAGKHSHISDQCTNIHFGFTLNVTVKIGGESWASLPGPNYCSNKDFSTLKNKVFTSIFVLHKSIFRYSVGNKYSKILKCIELKRSLYQLLIFFRTTAFTNNCAQIKNLRSLICAMFKFSCPIWILLGGNLMFRKVIHISI